MTNPQLLYQIRAAEKKTDDAEILIYDEIGASWYGEGITAKGFAADLAAVKAKRLRVRINSGGGSVFEGLAIYNALRTHSAKVTCEIDGVAASIASVIALAGDTVKMADNAFFMVHNPFGAAMGDADDMRAFADLLDKVGGSLAGIYAEKTGADEDQIQAWMDAETWFTAEEAKAAGFIDAITKGKTVEARADLAAYGNVPDSLRTTPQPTAAGGAASEPIPAPTEPAPVAREDSMSDKPDTAAHSGAAIQNAQDEARASERQRIVAIRQIAASHSIDQAKVDGWVDAGASIEQVNAAILGELQARAATAAPVRATVGAPRAEQDPRKGFESHRDFLASVIKNAGAGNRDAVKDERLRPLAISDDEGPGMAFMLPTAFSPKSIRATAGSDEQGNYADTYGGFMKPVQVQPGLMQLAFEGDPTAGLTTMVPMAAPTVKINARTDKNHATSVSGGLTFTRTPETAAATSSRMAIEQITLDASPLVGLAYATEQILSDSPVSFAALLAAGFNAQRAAHILNEKIHGLGGNQYLGVLNSPAKVEVAKETNQVADSIVYDNILAMRAQSYGFGQAVWLANHDCLPQLAKMSLAVGTGGSAVFAPGSFGQSPDTLLGRPILFTEYCSTVGDAGDIILVNWSQYLEGIYQPMKTDESIHVRFVHLERAFRFYERNCGAPWWRSALTPAKSAKTLSPIVTLAARA